VVSAKAPAEIHAALPLMLSFNGGYVDTAGFLALQGLFTAHVTGNFVTLGASLALGTSGAIAKLLALPVFCVIIFAIRLFNTVLSNREKPPLGKLIGLKVLLLLIGAVLAIHYGPFHNGDSAQAVATGMVLVAAMAIQNAFHRIHLASTPPSTLMTGTATQVMLDLADRIYAPRGADSNPRARLPKMALNILIFASGCGVAALLYSRVGVKCFVVPPVVAGLQLLLIRARSHVPGE
jgi:uncharacterized membrane protein YoaK (UPF0700 family)